MSQNKKKASVQRFLAERAVDAGGSLFVLIDRSLPPAIDVEILVGRCCRSYVLPVFHAAFSEDARKPILFEIRAEDVDLISLTVDAAFEEQSDSAKESISGVSISGWLEIDCPPSTAGEHIAKSMMMRRRSDKVGRIARLTDRRVFEFIWEMLSSQQKTDLLGPIPVWHTLDRCGSIRSHRTQAGDRNSTLRRRLVFGEAQWDRLDQCQRYQQMIRGWKHFSKELPPDYFQKIYAVLDSMINLGLRGDQDYILLGAYALQIHPLLVTHPTVRDLIKRSLVGGLPLAGLLADVKDPEGWDEIRRELESSQSIGPICKSA